MSGRVVSSVASEGVIDFATVYLEGTSYGGRTNEKGVYHIKAPAGRYRLVARAMGYADYVREIEVSDDTRQRMTIVMTPEATELEEVVKTSTHVSRINKSAYNAVAIDTRELYNTTKSLGDALAGAPGVKIRESGGVGSDLKVVLDGFSNSHVKVFIDGVPQEGVGSSFGLNNIPVNYAERIEVYRGVVPVGFGSAAIGGVINIVTGKERMKWHADASYSYGSFNTHKSYLRFGQSFRGGLTYEVNAFQNYSDNDYHIDNTVQRFEGSSSYTPTDIEHVRRFNDAYHNEAVSAKAGWTGVPFADRLMLGFSYSHMYQEVQNGVRQDDVFGQKHRKGYSVMPSLEYSKRDLLTKGLDVTLTANYNYNITNNIDTAAYQYNWFGERQYTGSPGEQSYMNTRSKNINWNATLTATYRIAEHHYLDFNHVMNIFRRTSHSRTGATSTSTSDYSYPKKTRKNIGGLAYRVIPSERWNATVFGKYYFQHNEGPVSENEDGVGNYVKGRNRSSSLGYGAAATYFILKDLQLKASYEKACRLPTNEELFGDEDLEAGKADLKPERSDNVNLSLSYSVKMGRHQIYVEGGGIYRHTKDYIQRVIGKVSGGGYYGVYSNYGKVRTKGFTLSARYDLERWLSIGGSYNNMSIRDDEKYQSSSSSRSLTYKARMPNIPYRYADIYGTFFWHDLFRKGITLSFTYDGYYQHEFPLYSEVAGSSSSKKRVPGQFSHDVAVTYSIGNGRYNFSFECKNLTDEDLYDNYSLQKPGRAFYGKVRIFLGSR